MHEDDKILPFPQLDAGRDRHFVTALARGLEILRAFRPGEGPLGNQELAKRTNLPKSTVSRLTSTLTQIGYLIHREDMGRYEPSPAVLSLGYTVLANNRLRALARPMMQDLAESVGHAVAMGARDRLSMVYVEACHSQKVVTLRLEIGSHIPMARTAMGRAFLCALPETEREYLLGHIARQSGDEWPALRAELEAAQRDYGNYGYCLSLGDWQRDVAAVGVPLQDRSSGDLLTLNCGGPGHQLNERDLRDKIAPRLVAIARNVEAMCGIR